MEYVAGIDQGGSTTRVAVADIEGNILSVGYASGGNQAVTGLAEAVEEIRTALEKALEKAPEARGKIVLLGAGICGVDYPHEAEKVRDSLEKELKIPAVVVNDCIGALRAETAEKNSIIICAGSGMNIGLLSTDGREFCFGYFIDDLHQGGESIGRAAVRAVKEASVGMRQAGALTRLVLEFFDQPSVDALVEWMNIGEGRSRLADIKYLAQVVDRAAYEYGDPAALEILKAFAEACVRYVAGGMQMYRMADTPCRIYLSGSIFKARSPILKETLRKGLLELNPKAEIFDAVFEPVVGAVNIALEDYLGNIPEKAQDNIAKSAGEAGLVRGRGYAAERGEHGIYHR